MKKFRLNFIYILLFIIALVACRQLEEVTPVGGPVGGDDANQERSVSGLNNPSSRLLSCFDGDVDLNEQFPEVSEILSLLNNYTNSMKYDKKEFKKLVSIVERPLQFPFHKLSLVVDSLATYENILASLQYKEEPLYKFMEILDAVNLDEPHSQDFRVVDDFVSLLDRMSDLTTKVVYEYFSKSYLEKIKRSKDKGVVASIGKNLMFFLQARETFIRLAMFRVVKVAESLDKSKLQLSDGGDLLKETFDSDRKIAGFFDNMQEHARVLKILLESLKDCDNRIEANERYKIKI